MFGLHVLMTQDTSVMIWDALAKFPDPVECGLFVLLPSHINPVEGPDVWIYILVIDTSFSRVYFEGKRMWDFVCVLCCVSIT